MRSTFGLRRITGGETSRRFRRIPLQRQRSKESSVRIPIVAAILSVIVAGLGQIYNGQIGKGVVFIILQPRS
jgi:hypothetical protein